MNKTQLSIFLLFVLSTNNVHAIDWEWIQPSIGYQSYSDNDIEISGIGVGGDLSIQTNKDSLQRFHSYYFSGKDRQGTIRGDAKNFGLQYSINYPKEIAKKTTLWYGYGGGASLSQQTNIVEVDNNNIFVQSIPNKAVIDLNVTLNTSIKYRINHKFSVESFAYLGRSTRNFLSGFYLNVGFLL